MLANPFGLYDLFGNVFEWCNDSHEMYAAGAVSDPTVSVAGAFRVLRGGGFVVGPSHLRSAYRDRNSPLNKTNFFGFRVARTIVPQAASARVRTVPEALSAGSVWKGQKTFQHGAQSPLTVSYELHVQERDGTKFKGHVFGNGPNRNRAEVEGEIDRDKITWRERDDSVSRLLTIEGILSGATIKVQFKGKLWADAPTEGDGELKHVAE